METVSIPSRRVGDQFADELSSLRFSGFHPLKAGRRLYELGTERIVGMSFHPLKAGRRRFVGRVLRGEKLVFPSPQGGSETISSTNANCCLKQFPSPQGGSETCKRKFVAFQARRVSIPSRRVGDLNVNRQPLKNFQVSIPSRRVGDQDGVVIGKVRNRSFHPLKAGRRRQPPCFVAEQVTQFPSPQGGSETRGNEGKGGQKKAKGREGCRRPSVGGKS